MKKLYLVITIILLIIALVVCGCGSTTTVIQQAPNSAYVPPAATSSVKTYTGQPNQIFNSASTETVPASGIYLQPGQTITLSWSADGNLTGYVFSSNQYSNWQQSHIQVTYDASGSGSTYVFSYTVQNADTYYAVLYDGASVFGNSVNDYSFTVTVR